MKKLDQQGSSHIIIILVIIALGVVGYGGWRVYRSKFVTQHAVSSCRCAIPPERKFPLGVDERPQKTYKNLDLGFTFTYPEVWGDVKVVEINGFNVSGQKSRPPTGVAVIRGSFSKNVKFNFAVRSTVFAEGAHGGFSPIDFGNYCMKGYAAYGTFQGDDCSKSNIRLVNAYEDITVFGNGGIVFRADYGSESDNANELAYGAIVRVNSTKEFPTITFEDLDALSNDQVKNVANTVKKF